MTPDTFAAIFLAVANVALIAWCVRQYRRDRAWEAAVTDALDVAAPDDDTPPRVPTQRPHPGQVRVWRANEIRRQTEAGDQ